MKKFSVLALVLALALTFTACASPSGLLLKEATVKQLDLQSFESMSTFSLDVNTQLFKNSFALDVYSKQVDMFNSLSEVYLSQELLALAGFDLPSTSDGKVALELLMKNGDLILSTSEDELGILLTNALSIPEADLEELPFDQEELEEWILSLQDEFRSIFKAYLADYNFTLDQIKDNGQKTIALPNGERVETRHIEVQFSALDLLDMLHYSLTHFIEDEEFQETFYSVLIDNIIIPLMEKLPEEEAPAESELAELRETVQTELNTAVQELATGIEQFITQELSEHEQLLVDSATFTVDTYIGVEDMETYQSDFRLNFTYTEELSKLIGEEAQNIPLLPGDSFSFVLSQQIWNHNQELDPVAVPGEIIPWETIMEMESVEEFKELAGENSLLAQFAEQAFFYSDTIVGFAEATSDEVTTIDLRYVELNVEENSAETPEGNVELTLYEKEEALMAPLAFVSEQLGAEVTWDSETKQILVTTEDHSLRVELSNHNTVYLDEQVRSDILVESIDGTSYVNVNTLAEAMGWTLVELEKGILILQ